MIKMGQTETSEDYWAPIASDKSVSLRVRLFRECEAMLAHLSSRNIRIEPDQAAEIAAQAVILEHPPTDRVKVEFSQLLILHRRLADAIAPELPKTIELLAWDARNKRILNRLAPVAAMRWLLAFSILALIGVVYIATCHPIGEKLAKPLFPATGTASFYGTIVLLLLAAIGASYKIIQDARKYVVEGTYDPRIGSNYWIRVIGGVLSGFILATLLFDSNTAPNGDSELRSFGKPLVALIGGFSGQVVFEFLTRIVDALSSTFGQTAEQQREQAEEKAKLAEALGELERWKDRAQKISDLQARLVEAKGDPAKTSEILADLTRLYAEDGGANATEGAAGPLKAAGIAAQAKACLALGERLLPDVAQERQDAFAQKLAEMAETLDRFTTAANAGNGADQARIAGELEQLSGPGGAVGRELHMLLRALEGGRSANDPPAGALARLVIDGSSKLADGAPFDRWKACILGTTYRSSLIPQPPDNALIAAVLAAQPQIAGLFAERLIVDIDVLSSLFLRLADENQDLAGLDLGEDFSGGADDLVDLRQEMVVQLLLRDLAAVDLALAGLESWDEAVKLLVGLRDNGPTLAAMESLTSVARSAARDGGPEELALMRKMTAAPEAGTTAS